MPLHLIRPNNIIALDNFEDDQKEVYLILFFTFIISIFIFSIYIFYLN